MVKLKINLRLCLACGGCISICPKDALSMISSKAKLDYSRCINCGICIKICPIGAIKEE